MLSPSFKDKPNAITTGEHQFCGPWRQHRLRAEVQGGGRDSQGASWWKAWLKGCSYTGSVHPQLALWVLGGWFPATSQGSKAFIFFFHPSKSAVASKQFSSRILHFAPALHGVGVKAQGGACSPGCERRGTPAVGASLFSSQLRRQARAKSSSLFSSIQVTLISAFVFPQLPPKPVNIFFAFCISLCCISAGILVSTAMLAVQAFESMTEDEI